MHSLPNKLKFYRKKIGMTQQQVAKHLNITQEAYCYYERGKREPDLTTLIRLADLFDESLDFITGRYVKATTDNRISVENNVVVNGGINIRQSV
jgi:transcriptional regulator with XRE-family HTH domain